MRTATVHQSNRPRKMLSALCAAAVLVMGLFTLSTPARAADTPTVLDSVEFQNTTFRDQSVQTLTVAWNATESPAEPTVRVEFELPPELRGQASTFSIGNGTCTVTTTQVSCVVDDSYVLSNPLNIRGEFTIRVQVDLRNTETVPGATFTVGNVLTTPPVTITSRYCTENCDFGGYGNPGKGGSYNNSTDNITWTVTVPTRGDGVSSEDGGRSLAAGQTVVVTDLYDQQGNPFTLVSGSPTVQRASCLITNQWNEQSLIWTTVNPADYTVTNGGREVEFTTVAGTGCAGQDPENDPEELTGSVYRVIWVVHAEDGGKGVTGPGTYRNEATIQINGVAREAAGNATRFSNSGTAIGENYARFELAKVFDVGSHVLTPPSITVEYTIAYPDDIPAPSSGTITLNSSNSWQHTSPEIFAGSTVTLREIDPWPSNIAGSSTLAIDGVPVTANPDGSYTFTATHAPTPLAYQLTNVAALDMQVLFALKEIQNPDGVTIPEGVEFELIATWPADPDLAIAAGAVSVALPADGTLVALPEMPEGANVTFTESPPPAVPGATWIDWSVSPSSLIIGPDSATVTVTVTNVLSRNVGTFTIDKELTGDAAGLVTDRTFDVTYSYPADPSLGIEQGSGSVAVNPDGPPVVVTAPAGAVVTLSETPVPVEGGTWAEPVFNPGNVFTVVQDANVTIELTNLIALNTGAFSIHKVLEGNATERVPADTEFVVRYSYPAGNGFSAGEGELLVRPGATTQSPQLPYGAVLSLTEAAPEDIDGANWANPRFSTTTVTIGDGTTVAVTLTNTIIDPRVLAATGWDHQLLVVLALVFVTAGLGVMLVRSRPWSV